MAASSGLFLATIYNQSQLAERKHVARYWSINTAATAVPLSAHPSPLVITTKLAAAILGVPLFGGGVLPAQYYPCAPDYLPFWLGTVSDAARLRSADNFQLLIQSSNIVRFGSRAFRSSAAASSNTLPIQSPFANLCHLTASENI